MISHSSCCIQATQFMRFLLLQLTWTKTHVNEYSKRKKHVSSHSSKCGGSFSDRSFRKYAFEKLSYDQRTLSAETSHRKEESKVVIGRPSSAGIEMKATRDQGRFPNSRNCGRGKVVEGTPEHMQHESTATKDIRSVLTVMNHALYKRLLW